MLAGSLWPHINSIHITVLDYKLRSASKDGGALLKTSHVLFRESHPRFGSLAVTAIDKKEEHH